MKEVDDIMNGVVVEMLKSEGISVIDWLLRIFNRCRESGVASEDWKEVCIVPIYKRKCANYRGISILSIAGKIYNRRVLVCRVMENTKKTGNGGKGGFKSGRGCIDTKFVLKELVEEYREKSKEVYVAIMDLEKAYLYEGSRAYVRLVKDESSIKCG